MSVIDPRQMECSRGWCTIPSTCTTLWRLYGEVRSQCWWATAAAGKQHASQSLGGPWDGPGRWTLRVRYACKKFLWELFPETHSYEVVKAGGLGRERKWLWFVYKRGLCWSPRKGEGMTHQLFPMFGWLLSLFFSISLFGYFIYFYFLMKA